MAAGMAPVLGRCGRWCQPGGRLVVCAPLWPEARAVRPGIGGGGEVRVSGYGPGRARQQAGGSGRNVRRAGGGRDGRRADR